MSHFSQVLSHFSQVLSRFSQVLSHFSQVLSHFSQVLIRFSQVLIRFSGALGRYKGVLGRYTGVLGRYKGVLGRYNGVLGRFKGVLLSGKAGQPGSLPVANSMPEVLSRFCGDWGYFKRDLGCSRGVFGCFSGGWGYFKEVSGCSSPVRPREFASKTPRRPVRLRKAVKGYITRERERECKNRAKSGCFREKSKNVFWPLPGLFIR
jgi:hypothetical protein